MRRLVDRAGWNVLAFLTTGNTTDSMPGGSDRDERAVCLLQSKIVPTLRAFPNPVPAEKGLGKTTISWNTANGDTGKVCVSTNGGEESLFATSREGSAPANWIRTGSTYEFRLYNSDHTKLLASIVVTKAAQ